MNRAVMSQALGDGEIGSLSAPGLAAAKNSIPEHTIKTDAKEAAEVDHDEMRDRLYKMASTMMTAKTAS